MTDPTREFYNERWRLSEYSNSLRARRCATILEVLGRLELFEPRILDLGCGTGWFSVILSQFGPTTGVDFSDFAIQQASTKYPWINFLQADLRDWNIPAQLEPFDLVVSQEVVEHFEDQETQLRLAHRLLKDGGYLILTTPNARTLARMEAERRHACSNQPIENVLTLAEIARLAKPGFEILQLRTFIRDGGVRGFSRIVNSYKLAKLLGKLRLQWVFEEFCMRAGFGLHILLLARKKSGSRWGSE